MNSRILVFINFLGLVLLAGSCRLEPETSDLIKDMVVETNVDKSTVFSSYTSYTMPMDTLGKIYNADPTDSLVLGEYAQLITNTVKVNMDAAGYKQVPRSQAPDLAMNVFVIRDFNVSQSVVYPGYYGGYPGYFYPGYYGYGGYAAYPYVNTYVTNSGTLVIEAIDLKNRDEKNQVRAVWTAYIGDVIATLDLRQKSKEAVDQAFKQSPYFKR